MPRHAAGVTFHDTDNIPMSSDSYAAPGLADGGPKIRLGIMMFLQYAVWGVWLPVLAIYLLATTDDGGLGFSGAQVGWILGVAAASGALVAPFIAGQIADRFLNAEIALGILLAFWSNPDGFPGVEPEPV